MSWHKTLAKVEKKWLHFIVDEEQLPVRLNKRITRGASVIFTSIYEFNTAHLSVYRFDTVCTHGQSYNKSSKLQQKL